MAQYYEWEAKELLDLIKGLPQDKAVEQVANYIDAKVEGALDAVDGRWRRWGEL